MEKEIEQLIDPIYRDKVLAARRTPLSKKMGTGGELFFEVCGRMRSGIRAQFPDLTERDVREKLAQRLRRVREINDTPNRTR